MSYCFLNKDRSCSSMCTAYDEPSEACRLLLAVDAVTKGVLASFRASSGATKHPKSPPPPEVKK